MSLPASAPDTLRDTAQAAYDQSKALIARWHGVDRLSYVITPRFAPTSTPDQLAALGALWAEHPDCPMQTHLSEQTEEIAWVAQLFPKACDYLDVYERFGLLGPSGLYGHAIHLTARERDRLLETGAALVHCPTSNTFIGSGLFDMAGLKAQGQRIGLAQALGKVLVELHHDLLGGQVVDLPEAHDHIPCSRRHKCACQRKRSFTLLSGTCACVAGT